MGPEDVAITRMVRRELNRRKIDSTLADVRVMHGVVYIRGVIRGMRGGATDVKAEMDLIARLLRQKTEIREVNVDVMYRG